MVYGSYFLVTPFLLALLAVLTISFKFGRAGKMEESNNVEERIMRELRVAEAIVDKMLVFCEICSSPNENVLLLFCVFFYFRLTELQAIVELTGKNGRVDKLVDKVSIYWFYLSSGV